MAFKTEKDVLAMAQKDGQYWSDYDKELAKRDPDAGLSIYTAKKNYLNSRTNTRTRNTGTRKQRVSGHKWRIHCGR